MVTLLDMAGHLIRRLHQKSTQLFQQRMDQAGYDITPVQFAAMQALKANPGIEQAQVAALIAYDRATIGGVIDRLEQKGYISRVVSKKDRRAREVSLTAEGEQLLDQVFPLVLAMQDDILDELTGAEREQFLKLAKQALGY
jgi:DNA-binding MarR family transcriptional regulator